LIKRTAARQDRLLEMLLGSLEGTSPSHPVSTCLRILHGDSSPLTERETDRRITGVVVTSDKLTARDKTGPINGTPKYQATLDTLALKKIVLITHYYGKMYSPSLARRRKLAYNCDCPPYMLISLISFYLLFIDIL